VGVRRDGHLFSAVVDLCQHQASASVGAMQKAVASGTFLYVALNEVIPKRVGAPGWPSTDEGGRAAARFWPDVAAGCVGVMRHGILSMFHVSSSIRYLPAVA
jgi:hypothetical protein